MTEKKAEIGIFGGTGIYDSGMLQDSKEITMDTPYGETSDSITIEIYWPLVELQKPQQN